MSFATATFTAAGQSTRDNTNNPRTFPKGTIQIMASDAGSFSGTIQLRRSFVDNTGAKGTPEVVDAWDQTALPLTREMVYVPGVELDLFCSACAAGSAKVSLGSSY